MVITIIGILKPIQIYVYRVWATVINVVHQIHVNNVLKDINGLINLVNYVLKDVVNVIQLVNVNNVLLIIFILL